MALSYEQRCDIIERIAERYLDSMDGRGLEQFFFDVSTERLAGCDDDELVSELEQLIDEDEFQEIFGYEA